MWICILKYWIMLFYWELIFVANLCTFFGIPFTRQKTWWHDRNEKYEVKIRVALGESAALNERREESGFPTFAKLMRNNLSTSSWYELKNKLLQKNLKIIFQSFYVISQNVSHSKSDLVTFSHESDVSRFIILANSNFSQNCQKLL